ncbi:hypothetical protein PI23P_04182 [Polaribacter irgensii 23-P]|uniref:Uncharacterized protein n=1 Tax=Polaribacter irgensii 23-P TaxID=313594 RepID=A4BXH3_9FLAO|nr:hypothetical protein PI23P_04182 [Polaribacter irgensii 23-P]
MNAYKPIVQGWKKASLLQNAAFSRQVQEKKALCSAMILMQQYL